MNMNKKGIVMQRIYKWIACYLPHGLIRACYCRVADVSQIFWIRGLDEPKNTNEYQLKFWDSCK